MIHHFAALRDLTIGGQSAAVFGPELPTQAARALTADVPTHCEPNALSKLMCTGLMSLVLNVSDGVDISDVKYETLARSWPLLQRVGLPGSYERAVAPRCTIAAPGAFALARTWRASSLIRRQHGRRAFPFPSPTNTTGTHISVVDSPIDESYAPRVAERLARLFPSMTWIEDEYDDGRYEDSQAGWVVADAAIRAWGDMYILKMRSGTFTSVLYTYTRLERAASIANLAVLRSHSEPSQIQIQTINWLTFLLESDLRTLPPDETPIRARVLDQLAINRSMLAPIRRLPVELLSEIFSRVVDKFPLRTLQFATTISHVCADWRSTARAHAALWTKVIVETMHDFDEYCEQFLPMTKKALLELRCDAREVLGDLWDRIDSYASRWRRIKLEARLSTLTDLKVLYMENLERLIIDAYDVPVSADLSALDFVVAPRLRHVSLTVDVLQSDRQLHIPVTRSLTSLEIASVSPFDVTLVLPLLQACANTLQSLTIKIRQAYDGAVGSYHMDAPSLLVMQALTYLSLVDPACALLNLITAPLTGELVLSAVPAYGTRALKGFLTRGNPRHLHTLRVYDVEERDPSSWIPCLKHMCNLRHLHFDDMMSNEEFLEQMIKRENKPLLLPALRGIAIWQIYWNHLELHDIIDEMCSSRSKETKRSGLRGWTLIKWLDADWGLDNVPVQDG
ncbi:hypothetical protein EV121DRAFT_292167 [Schizophyllum commune]